MKIKYLTILISLITMLTNCAHYRIERLQRNAAIVLPDGSAGMSLGCAVYKSKCYQTAGRLCPYGYDIVEEFGSDQASEGLIKYRRNTTYSMLIKCKEQDRKD